MRASGPIIDGLISIHSPLAGRDGRETAFGGDGSHFNPLAPRGARPCRIRGGNSALRFQSTRPSRGETVNDVIVQPVMDISIHSPLAGRDVPAAAGCRGNNHNFNPLAPRGARPPFALIWCRAIMLISIHSPLAGRDSGDRAWRWPDIYFNPLAPRGARLSWLRASDQNIDFNPLAPRGARPSGSATIVTG